MLQLGQWIWAYRGQEKLPGLLHPEGPNCRNVCSQLYGFGVLSSLGAQHRGAGKKELALVQILSMHTGKKDRLGLQLSSRPSQTVAVG